MAYMDSGRPAPFGSIAIYRATSVASDAAARVERWFGRRDSELSRLTPAELEDIGLSVADIAAPRRGFFDYLADSLRAWQARRVTLNALGRLTDAQLDDIGLTRFHVEELRAGRIAR
jgi:uncharacterized protein YjiS (DUF1127 family)